MKIIHELDDDTNVFVISHKGDILDGKFAKRLNSLKIKTLVKLNKTVYNGTPHMVLYYI
jgi:hypothetical protein